VKLLVGLGNPGQKYARNRHNIGFMAIEAIADRHRFGPWKAKFQGRIADGDIGGEKVVLLAPQTYMNDSGRSVQEAARFLKIDDKDIIVLHDELDLAPGKVRTKLGGGNAGHNGLRSITAHRSNDYWRVRIGIGHPGHKDLVHNWVLGDFAKADQAWLDDLLAAMSDAAPFLAKGETERFMSEVARLTGAEPDKPAKPKPANAPDAPTKPPRVTGHPAGERVNKKQNAIAENLQKWLAAKKAKDGE
jgi:peptidyl-tRNA hydrolase, PTH1 family